MSAIPSRAPHWRRTPPAVFPPILGLFGLGLAWRGAGGAFGIDPAPAEAILGAVTLVYLAALGAYLAKAVARPGAVMEDLRVLPGRAGLAAMSMCAMGVAAALVPVAPGLARATLFGSLFLHLAVAVLVAVALVQGPPEQRRITPAWHLAFVGFILAPAASVPLGYLQLSRAIVALTLAAAVVIWGASLVQLIRRDPPPPLRPMLAIHLAPASLFGSAALALDRVGAAAGFAVLASAMLLALLVRGRYVAAAGFTPLWGAFTFPLAAYAKLLLGLSVAGAGLAVQIASAAVLAAATVAIPWIAVKVLQGWVRGTLAAQTNAATA